MAMSFKTVKCMYKKCRKVSYTSFLVAWKLETNYLTKPFLLKTLETFAFN